MNGWVFKYWVAHLYQHDFEVTTGPQTLNHGGPGMVFRDTGILAKNVKGYGVFL